MSCGGCWNSFSVWYWSCGPQQLVGTQRGAGSGGRGQNKLNLLEPRREGLEHASTSPGACRSLSPFLALQPGWPAFTQTCLSYRTCALSSPHTTATTLPTFAPSQSGRPDAGGPMSPHCTQHRAWPVLYRMWDKDQSPGAMRVWTQIPLPPAAWWQHHVQPPIPSVSPWPRLGEQDCSSPHCTKTCPFLGKKDHISRATWVPNHTKATQKVCRSCSEWLSPRIKMQVLCWESKILSVEEQQAAVNTVS